MYSFVFHDFFFARSDGLLPHSRASPHHFVTYVMLVSVNHVMRVHVVMLILGYCIIEVCREVHSYLGLWCVLGMGGWCRVVPCMFTTVFRTH